MDYTLFGKKYNPWKIALATLVSLYFIHHIFVYKNVYTDDPSFDQYFLHSIDLVIHEAGHAIFAFFGEFLYILGGSLFQIVFPMIFVGYFYKRRDYFSASVLAFWVGENILDVSLYMSDAIARQLPLLGGADVSSHDWSNLFTMMNVLKETPLISGIFASIGILVILAAVFFSFWSSFDQDKDF